VDTVERYLAQK